MLNPWEILGLSEDATDAEIKAVFRALAVKHHPDHGGSNEAFIKISKAFALIKTEAKRERYKKEGETPPITTKTKAREYLCNALMNEIRITPNLEDLKYVNIINRIRGNILKELDKILKDRISLLKAIKDLTELADRITVKDKDNTKNILRNIIINEIMGIKVTQKTMLNQIRMLSIAKYLLKKYDYRTDFRSDFEAHRFYPNNSSTIFIHT